MCVRVCVCVCVSLAFIGHYYCHHHQTWHGDCQADMRMYYMLTILTLTFIQGRTDLNHEHNKCSIISEIVQAMLIMFSVKIVRD